MLEIMQIRNDKQQEKEICDFFGNIFLEASERIKSLTKQHTAEFAKVNSPEGKYKLMARKWRKHLLEDYDALYKVAISKVSVAFLTLANDLVVYTKVFY